jgi:hypothetical protein
MLNGMRLLMHCLLAAALGLLLGCREKEPSAPRPPSTGGTAATSGGVDPRPQRDSGAGDDRDAGGDRTDGGVLPSECREIPVVQVPESEIDSDTEASTTSPLDFEVSRLVGAWQGGCREPEFRVELSGGGCPGGNGHALTFLFDGAALRDGAIRLGLNSILPEPNDTGVRIRYVRPSRLDPEGEWGTCTAASGDIDLLGTAPSSEEGTRLEARFSLDLTACNDSTEGLQTLRGTFDVLMRRGLEDICPTP